MRRFAIGLALGCGLGCDPDLVSSDEQHQAEKPTQTWEAEPKGVGNLRVATFNIRNFPSEAGMTGAPESTAPGAPKSLDTDIEMLLDVLEELDFDVLAVQEIRDPSALRSALEKLGERLGTTFDSAFSENAVSGNEQQAGVVVRADRLALESSREHPEVDVKGTLRAGLSARIRSRSEGGADFGVLVLHLASGDSHKRAALRAEQAKAASLVVHEAALAAADGDFIVLGDLNTARGDAELSGLDQAFDAHVDLSRLHNDTGCSSYFVKNKLGALHPSLIDQVYLGDLGELDAAVPLRSGAHCVERACEPFESDGPETGTSYWGVSDHCPVYFEIADQDRD